MNICCKCDPSLIYKYRSLRNWKRLLINDVDVVKRILRICAALQPWRAFAGCLRNERRATDRRRERATDRVGEREGEELPRATLIHAHHINS